MAKIRGASWVLLAILVLPGILYVAYLRPVDELPTLVERIDPWQQPIPHLQSLYQKYAEDLKKMNFLADLFCRDTVKPVGWPHVHHCLSGTAESEIVYMRLRELRPQFVLEVSSAVGYSTMWILQALADNNNDGVLHSFDVYATPWPTVLSAELKKHWVFHLGDVKETLKEVDTLPFSYIYVDTAHDKQFAQWYVRAILDHWTPVHVNVHDIYDPTLEDLPTAEGMVVLQWLMFSGKARNVFCINDRVHPEMSAAVETMRASSLGQDLATRPIGGRHDLKVSLFFELV